MNLTIPPQRAVIQIAARQSSLHHFACPALLLSRAALLIGGWIFTASATIAAPLAAGAAPKEFVAVNTSRLMGSPETLELHRLPHPQRRTCAGLEHAATQPPLCRRRERREPAHGLRATRRLCGCPACEARCATQAADGRLELSKTSQKFDGPPGREQHEFPSQKEMAG